jgi:hypothetical protein
MVYNVVPASLTAANHIPERFANYLKAPGDPTTLFTGIALKFAALALAQHKPGSYQQVEVVDAESVWAWSTGQIRTRPDTSG